MTVRRPLAVSMGEPAGIGPDLILQLYARRAELKLPPFVVFGHADFLASRARRLGLDITLAPGDDEAAQFTSALPVHSIDGLVPDQPGTISHVSGKVVIESIAVATAAVLTGRCRAIVTAPIHKAALYGAGFKYPGHTEYLAALCARGGVTPLPVMMLAHDDLRVVPLTIHVPLRDVPGLVTPALIAETARIVAHDLRTRFGIATPRIGVCGLNPHAGESGSIGTEDRDIILPTVLALQAEGIAVDGPFSADTAFHLPNWRRYDAVIAMYHDQALIPIKTVAFDSGVNVTLGLPIVRTSPDHGTALDLAGTGKASPSSLLAALRLADRLAA